MMMFNLFGKLWELEFLQTVKKMVGLTKNSIPGSWGSEKSSDIPGGWNTVKFTIQIFSSTIDPLSTIYVLDYGSKDSGPQGIKMCVTCGCVDKLVIASDWFIEFTWPKLGPDEDLGWSDPLPILLMITST